MVLRADVLKSTHGFSMREGGVSKGPYASLNTSFSVGDEPEAVAENLARLAEVARVSMPIRTVTQVHGTEVVCADTSDGQTPADALWTESAGVCIGIRTADCVPILIEDSTSMRVAAVHAGWRGVIGRIVERTIELLITRGARLSELRFAIGPCIEACCFEVDGDLPTRFAAEFGEQVVVRDARPRAHLDLRLALDKSLNRFGVSPTQVGHVRHCTSCDSRFFSHRRDRGVTGRQLAFITCGSAPVAGRTHL